MIIQNSSIQLFSEHTAIEQHKQRESLQLWSNRRISGDGSRMQQSERHDRGRHLGQLDRIDLSQRVRQSQPQRALAVPVEEDEKAIAELNIRILRAMIQRLTGKVMDIRLPQDAAPGSVGEGAQIQAEAKNGNGSAGFGIVYDYYESHYEYESTSFAANGVITTADGREINFDVQLNMSREFMQEQRVSLRAGDALKDPLAVNFSGTAAQLSQKSYTFDIDMDGRDDQIAFTAPGSGFLALDKNQDGIINNGGELFGPATGEGFAELAAYDDDGNLWIDENDDIFQHLRIWSIDSEGQSRLLSLGEAGIGAIYLNHIATPFSIKNDDNELLGQVRDSGIFLRENGSVGTIQQIDLAV